METFGRGVRLVNEQGGVRRLSGKFQPLAAQTEEDMI
jgi:hypothetical protein